MCIYVIYTHVHICNIYTEYFEDVDGDNKGGGVGGSMCFTMGLGYSEFMIYGIMMFTIVIIYNYQILLLHTSIINAPCDSTPVG